MKKKIESAKSNRVSYRRRLLAKVNRQKLYSPTELLRPHRLDVAAKTIFARSYIEGNESTWPEEVYREHLRVWNNFKEGYPKKSSYEDFRNAFTKIISDTVSNKYAHHKSPVSMDRYGRFENGSHRLSVALVLDKFVNVYNEKIMTAGDWDYNFFKYWQSETTGEVLDEKYTDAMTLEYLRLAPSQMYAVIIFPSANGHMEYANRCLGEFGHILNSKEIDKNSLSPTAVIRQVYAGEWWNNDDHIKDVQRKAGLCFEGEESVKVYIIRSERPDEDRIGLKKALRDKWGVDKHSIHISDTPEETYRIATLFFHRGTLNFLRKNREYEFLPEFRNKFNHLLSIMPEDTNLRERLCIDSSAVMALYGIREAHDIDYLYRLEDPLNGGDDIVSSSRGEHSHARWYRDSVDELVTNPSNHFYYNGIKFLALNKVLEMKRCRGEAKDKEDVKLIEDYIDKNKELFL